MTHTTARSTAPYCHCPLIDPLVCASSSYSLSRSLFSHLFTLLQTRLWRSEPQGGINGVFVFFSAVFPKERCWICASLKLVKKRVSTWKNRVRETYQGLRNAPSGSPKIHRIISQSAPLTTKAKHHRR